MSYVVQAEILNYPGTCLSMDICSSRSVNLCTIRLAAKDSHTWKVIVPLVMGFKMTGVLIFAITAVKLFLLKVFAVSQLALLAAGFLVVRKLMSSMAAQQHPYQFTHQPLHYYNDYGLAEGLPYSNYLTAGGNYVAPTGHGFEASASEEPATSAADDLQAHFSNNVLTNVKISAANHTTTNKHGKLCFNI
jgi:hypothetical protein